MSEHSVRDTSQPRKENEMLGKNPFIQSLRDSDL